MPVVTLSPLVRQQFNSNGSPVANGLLFAYAAGTTNKATTYKDFSGTTPNTNPIVLDENGECDLWLDESEVYKLVLSPPGDTDPPTNPLWTRDNIDGSFTPLTPRSFNQIYQTAINGYPKGTILIAADFSGTWVSTVDNNTTDPDTGGAGWVKNPFGSLPAMTFSQVAALTSDQGPIYVSDHHSMAYFSASAYYNGYRNLKCGDWYVGSMSPSRPGEIDGIGGIFNIADYPSLWGWANERGFVVPSASWVPSATNYSLIGTTQFRVPDYRNMFPRVEGTDVDTANPRTPGMTQDQQMPSHDHTMFSINRYSSIAPGSGSLTGIDSSGPSGNYRTGLAGSGVDQRPGNTIVSAVISV